MEEGEKEHRLKKKICLVGKDEQMGYGRELRDKRRTDKKK